MGEIGLIGRSVSERLDHVRLSPDLASALRGLASVDGVTFDALVASLLNEALAWRLARQREGSG
jgi:hypothetical protein